MLFSSGKSIGVSNPCLSSLIEFIIIYIVEIVILLHVLTMFNEYIACAEETQCSFIDIGDMSFVKIIFIYFTFIYILGSPNKHQDDLVSLSYLLPIILPSLISLYFDLIDFR